MVGNRRVVKEGSIFRPIKKPISRKMLREGEDQFRMIRFPQTEGRLGLPPRSFMSKENKGRESFDKIRFVGTRNRLGPPPAKKMKGKCK